MILLSYGKKENFNPPKRKENGAISGDIVRMGLKHGAGINDVPHFGDIVIQIKADRKTLSVEGSVDISRIDD